MIGLLDISKFLLYEFLSVSVTTEYFIILGINSQCESVYFSIKSFALTSKVLFFVRFSASVTLGRAEISHSNFTPEDSPSSSLLENYYSLLDQVVYSNLYSKVKTVQALWINQFILERARRLAHIQVMGTHHRCKSGIGVGEAVVSLFVNFGFLNLHFRFPFFLKGQCL